MSLPAAQQHILDGIADRLRRTEPRLAGMYATFTRLCGNDGPPGREQLSAGCGRHLIGALITRLPKGLRLRPRRDWQLVLIASHVAVAIVLLSVLVGLSMKSTSTCGQPRRHQPMVDARLWCAPQTVANGLISK